MTPKELAQSLGHGRLLDHYEQLREVTSSYKNDDVAELDIVYFLQNILWSTNFELIAKVIVDYGMESRLDQWKGAITALKTNK